MKKIGILGGTFNPIHFGHLGIAHAAFEKLKLDKVIFIPSNMPPHKSSKNLIPGEERYKLIQKAIKDLPCFEVSDLEIKREGTSYSIDTVLSLEKSYKRKAKFFFIIGSDSYPTLNTWKRINEILQIVTFIVVNRHGIKKIKPKIKAQFIDMPELDISSTFVRKRITSGKTVEHLIPEAVIKYINKNKLYK